MSDIHCRLCASDEGVFLDIFGTGNKSYCGKLESCLSLKVEKGDAFSTKLCHKCAYEVNQCDKFVRKYKETRHTLACSKASQQKNRCSLCAQTNKSGHIFQLTNDKQSIDASRRKIYECFEQDPPKVHVSNLLICLQCRYNLDVLSDLKVLSQQSVEKLKRISAHTGNPSDLSKPSTLVVSRKTTSILREKIDVIEISDTESDSSTMKPFTRSAELKRAKNGKISNKQSTKPNRICGQCHNTIKNGVDMYRFHSTGLTVCKFCWSTVDPSKTSLIKKKAQGTTAKKNTRLCSVFLTDVMGDASLKDNRGYKIEKDEEGNTTFVLMDDNSEEDNSIVKIKKEAEESVFREVRTRSRRSRSDVEDSSVKAKPVKKLKSDGESSEQIFNSGVRKSLRHKTIKIEEIHDINSDTAVSKKRKAPKVQSQSEKKKKGNKITSFSDDEVQIITSRITRTSLRARKSDVSPSELSESMNGSSSSESNSARPKRKTRAVKVTPMSRLFEKNVVETVKVKTRSNSMSSKESTPPSDFKSLEKSSKSSSSSRKSPWRKAKVIKKAHTSKTDAIDRLKKDKEEYVCNICNIGYKNKLIGMTHELSHLKQPEITLCRIRPANEIKKTKETAESESAQGNVSTDFRLEEQSHDVSSTSDALREKTNQESAVSETDVVSLKQKENPSNDKKVDSADVAESNDLVSTEGKSKEVEFPEGKEVASEQEVELETSKKETTQNEGKEEKLSSPVDTVSSENEKAEENNKEVLKPVEGECEAGKAESVDVEEEKETLEESFQLSVEAKQLNPDSQQISQVDENTNVDDSRNEVKKNSSDTLKITAKVSTTENDKSTTSKDINEVEDVKEDNQAEVCPTLKESSSEEVLKELLEADDKDVEENLEVKEKDPETAPALINLNGSITKDSESKELTHNKPEEKNEAKDKEEDKNIEEENDDEEIITSIYVADDEFLEDESEEDQRKRENENEANENIPEEKSEENEKSELVDISVKADSNTEKETNKESVKIEEVLTKMFEEETPVTSNQDTTQISKSIGPSEENIPETLENISKEICKKSQENEKDESKNSSTCSLDLNIGKGEPTEKKKFEEECIAQNT